MNIINQINVEYITSCKSIEIIQLAKSDSLIYIYNYQGNYFRVFTQILEMFHFFYFGIEPKFAFNSDDELDIFLQGYKG